ncbi:hypothetical protein K9N68_39670 (plasmid) [Kovacikia minuta CCNUW1]|uniref:hypothetical protein n=1 Tax=Kovacikia minuta TaxID=2931930 RepID=UPI001CCA3A5B|nr:hypothetical protein [Kovacikia minuta]UBF30775.1 hypothetical protein K9N68_39670 [Kovacikia minuta CCNUW1]
MESSITIDRPRKFKWLPLTTPPEGFQYQAFGVLSGTLIEDSDEGLMLLHDGQPLSLAGFSMQTLKKLRKREKPVMGFWNLYPRLTQNGLKLWVAALTETPTIEPGRFIIKGQVLSWGRGNVLLRVHRNEPREGQKPFPVQVTGFIPGIRQGQYWDLTCQWQDGELVTLEKRLFEISAVA